MGGNRNRRANAQCSAANIRVGRSLAAVIIHHQRKQLICCLMRFRRTIGGSFYFSVIYRRQRGVASNGQATIITYKGLRIIHLVNRQRDGPGNANPAIIIAAAANTRGCKNTKTGLVIKIP